MKTKRNRFQICLIAVLLATMKASGGIVTTLADGGSGSLRQIIASALNGDTIGFDTNGTIILTNELALHKSLTIIGPGKTNLVISGNHASRIFNIASNTTISISGLTIRDGIAPSNGGGIYNFGSLRLTNCLVTANQAGPGGWGGGIYSFGPLSLTACCVSENTSGSGTATVPPNPPISNGGNGGGIYCADSLILTNCTISDNSAGNGFGGGGSGGSGGGIHSDGPITLITCTINNNTAGTGSIGGIRGYIGGGPGGWGGGIYSGSSPIAIVASTISSNTAGIGGYDSDFPGPGGSGGGVYSAGPLTLTNCTINANSTGQGGSDGNGGGFYCADSLRLVACTVSGNMAGSGAGGGLLNGASGALLNSLIALNTAGSYPDLHGTFTSQGHNLLGETEGSSGLTNGVIGDLVGSTGASLNPLLGPLADNGGLTWTMALLPGSPAIDAGNDVLLVSPYHLATDQRGLARKSGSHVDIGAYEYQVPPGISNFGVQSNYICFKISGDSNLVVVVEACTNLFHPMWQRVKTNTLIGGASYFSDPQWTNYPGRFYRLRSP